MTDFLKHLQAQQGNQERAAIAFLSSLRQRGVYVAPKTIPKFIDCKMEGLDPETTKKLIQRIFAPDFEYADEMLSAIATSGYFLECPTLLRVPVIYGRNIDHNRTLSNLRKGGFDSRDPNNLFEEAEAYLTHLQTHNILLKSEEIHKVLPFEHYPILNNPHRALDLTQKFNIPLSVCPAPGWIEGQPHMSRIRLGQVWYENLSTPIEETLKSATNITGDICPDCAKGLGLDYNTFNS